MRLGRRPKPTDSTAWKPISAPKRSEKGLRSRSAKNKKKNGDKNSLQSRWKQSKICCRSTNTPKSLLGRQSWYHRRSGGSTQVTSGVARRLTDTCSLGVVERN